MEHAAEVIVLQAPYQWDDVGSWLALERMHAQDADGNTVMAEHCGIRTSGCVIAGDPGRLIATLGVKDLAHHSRRRRHARRRPPRGEQCEADRGEVEAEQKRDGFL